MGDESPFVGVLEYSESRRDETELLLVLVCSSDGDDDVKANARRATRANAKKAIEWSIFCSLSIYISFGACIVAIYGLKTEAITKYSDEGR